MVQDASVFLDVRLYFREMSFHPFPEVALAALLNSMLVCLINAKPTVASRAKESTDHPRSVVVIPNQRRLSITNLTLSIHELLPTERALKPPLALDTECSQKGSLPLPRSASLLGRETRSACGSLLGCAEFAPIPSEKSTPIVAPAAQMVYSAFVRDADRW